jgi:hypothetical protein
MTWQERQMEDAIALGDDTMKGQKLKAGGLYKERRETDTGMIYTFVQKDGEEKHVWGSAAIDNQIRETDMGKFIKLEFHGWGVTKRGQKFKQITVSVWDGPPTDEMRKWPQWEEMHKKLRNAEHGDNEPPLDPTQGEVDGPDEEDDLPFSDGL